MVTETYWRATHYMSDDWPLQEYADGKLSLTEKALAEQCYFAVCRRCTTRSKLVSARTVRCSMS